MRWPTAWRPTRDGPACACWSCPIRWKSGPRRRCEPLAEPTIDRSCGPSGCEVDWLTSARLDVEDDIAAFTRLATDAGWGDGLPLVPPTEERVRAHVAASGRFPDEVLGEIPPRGGRCT